MFSNIFEILAGVAFVVLSLYYYLTKNWDFWEKCHVIGPKPSLLFGNVKDVAFHKIHLADYLQSVYKTYYAEPVVGLFFRTSPVLLVKDPDFLKDIMIKNFTTFADRGVKIHEDIDPLSQHLVFLDPKKWKPMRKKLTPAFSSGKLKDMFYLMNECGHQFEAYLDKLVTKGEPVECRDLSAKFTTEVIGVCVFGLTSNSILDEDSEFRKVGKAIFENSWYNQLRHSIRNLPHWAAKLLTPIARNEKIINFFVNTLKDTMEYRRKHKVKKNDFVDILMEIQDHPEKVGEAEMDQYVLTAQAYVFFIAGFETSSATMSHAMYELALNPDVQDKLREEITATFEENNGKLTYDSIKSMKYMDKVFKETLRKYPPAPSVTRKALANHTFEGTKISIPKDTKIMIPIYSIHHDPNIYPDPDKFDPERFNEDVESTRPPMSYLPFGEGPRICIGERFAKYQSKVGLAVAIRHFKFEVCEKTTKYEKSLHPTLLAPKNGIYLRIKRV